MEGLKETEKENTWVTVEKMRKAKILAERKRNGYEERKWK